MAQKIKVYGTRSYRQSCPPAANGSRHTREIVAASSKVQAKLIAGWRIPLSEISETGNSEEIAIANTRPGVVFWKPLDAKNAQYTH